MRPNRVSATHAQRANGSGTPSGDAVTLGEAIC